uniref:Uncharacterized protein n=1 Tax=Oryza nivara TaxID=4536 RepID=A0A0E0G6I4_ORYNI
MEKMEKLTQGHFGDEGESLANNLSPPGSIWIHEQQEQLGEFQHASNILMLSLQSENNSRVIAHF